MAIKRQRAPRPGEILSWMSTHRGFRASPEEGASGPQLRVSPSPCCGNGKRGGAAVLNSRTGLWKCFACGKAGNWYGFTKSAGDPLKDPYQDLVPVDLSAYDRIRAKLRRPASQGHHPGLLNYCVGNRRIDPATLDAWRVSTCGPEALRWPLTAWDEKTSRWTVANARVRRVLGGESAPDSPRDWFEVRGGPTGLAIGNHLLGLEPTLWRAKRPSWAGEWLDPLANPPNGPADAGEPNALIVSQTIKCRRVLIVEGQWDAMTAWQLGIPNVLSLPNGASHVDAAALLRYVPDNAEVWIAPDMDDAGNRAAEAFFAQLGGGVRRLVLPAKDLNDWLREHPTLTAEEVLATAASGGASEQVPCPPEKQSVNIWTEAPATRPSEIVCETPWPLLTRRLGGGFRAGQTTGLLAPSGQGKTTLANNVIAQAVRERVKVGVIQLEGTRGEVYSTLRHQVKAWVNPDMDEWMDDYAKYLDMSALAGKAVTCNQTIEAAERMMKDGCKLVVVDNWDYITPGDGAGSRHKANAYAKLQELCKEHGAHGFVVWQPHKVDRNDVVNSGQQKGMSTALQDADVYMTLNRKGLMRRLEVEKVRSVAEEEGMSSVIILCYVKETKCLEQSKSQADLKPEGWKEF